jgi:D-inositol-3-phosphate glycosyltransferase
MIVANSVEQHRLARGSLDDPGDGAVIAGDVLRVRGWCIFGGSPVARVDVVVDGRSAGLARPYVDRHDIAEEFDDPDAPVAGFETLISFEDCDRSTESLVTVEAVSLDGRRWRSPTHRVRWEVPAPASTDRGTALATRSKAILDGLSTTTSGVLVFTHDLSYGGGQLWLFELLRQVTSFAALECTVVSMTDGPLRETLEDLGIAVHITAAWPMDSLDAYEGRIHELALLIRTSGAGVVLVNTLGIFPGIDAAARAGVPSLWAIHESFEPAVYRYICWGPNGMHPYVQRRFKACFQSTRALIFEARQTAEIFAHLSSPEQRFIVDYGVDVDAIEAYQASIDRSALRAAAGFDDEDVIMVVVGVVEPRKAQAAVVAAFDQLARAHPHLRLVLVGTHPSPYNERVREQITRSAFGARVSLVPIGPNVYPWYAIADLLVCASDIESLPRSILEAMAFELPVVSTDAFGIADLIDDGQTGWLTRSRDLEGLVGLLHLVLRLPQAERRAVGARARTEILRRHGTRSYGRIFARALADLLDNPYCDLAPALSYHGDRTASEEGVMTT